MHDEFGHEGYDHGEQHTHGGSDAGDPVFDAGHDALAGDLSAADAPIHVEYAADGTATDGPTPGTEVLGHPLTDATGWHYQVQNGMCGPDSLAMVISEFATQPVSENEVAQWAIAHGDMTPTGAQPSSTELGYAMTADQAVDVLSNAGVPCHLETSGNLASLEQWLASGRDIMLTIDGHQVWHDQAPQGDTNHMVVLTGIDLHTGYAYLNDPGSPDGKEEAVKLSELMLAWSASGDTAIVTDEVPPSHTVPDQSVTSQADEKLGPVVLPVVLGPRAEAQT